MARLAFLLVLLLGLAAPAAGQRAAVAGEVADAETGEPLPGAHVVLTGEGGEQALGATDEGGRFAFAGLLPGRYEMAASSVGYEVLRDTLEVGFGDRVELALALRPERARLGGVTVEADPGRATSSPAGLLQVRPADLAAIPAPDPGGDLAGALTLQPGIVAVGDRGGQLYVRGGTPTENLVLVDGMRLFQPFHIVGFYSAFPADIVQHADVYAGGFGARYGGRISSVIDVTTRAGSKHRFGGAATLAPFLAGLQIEGPLYRGEVSFLASGRLSAIERVGEGLYGRAYPYRFGDAFAKVHAFLSPTSFFTASGIVTADEGDLSGEAGGRDRVGWRNQAAAGRFFYMPPSFAAALDASVFYSAFGSFFEPEGAAARDSDVESFGGQFALAYLLGRHQVRLGFAAQTLKFAYAFDRAGREARESTGEGTFFLEADLGLGAGLRLEPGLRLQTFPSQARTVSFEPRLRASWDLSARHTLSAAAGVYRQEILGLVEQRDVGDVFLAWVPTREGAPVPRAAHLLLGWEGRPRPWLSLGAEAYAKDLSGLALLLGERGLVYVNGEVLGLDLRAEWRRAPLYVLLTYGLSATTYRDAPGTPDASEGSYRPAHDRRHRLAVLVRRAWGAWSASARWQLASGRPFTRVAGVYDALEVDPGGGFVGEAGTPTVLMDPVPFAGLTPPYHRLDLALERAFRLRGATLTAQATLVNAYDRANFFYYDVLRAGRVDQFPLIPSLGLRIETR